MPAIFRAPVTCDLVERSFAAAFEELCRQSEANTRSEKEEFATLVIFNMLERVGDQAVNICEETVFAVTGETKQAVAYRILFLDETNALLGPMALSIARKGYPKSGKYYTGGRHPAKEFDPLFRAFMEEHGNSIPEVPRGIESDRESWQDYYVLVALEGTISDYVAEVPFRTVALDWDVSMPDVKSLDEDQHRAALFRRSSSFSVFSFSSPERVSGSFFTPSTSSSFSRHRTGGPHPSRIRRTVRSR